MRFVGFFHAFLKHSLHSLILFFHNSTLLILSLITNIVSLSFMQVEFRVMLEGIEMSVKTKATFNYSIISM